MTGKLFTLTDAQASLLLEALSYRPWREVNDLIQNLHMQLLKHQIPDPPMPDTMRPTSTLGPEPTKEPNGAA